MVQNFKVGQVIKIRSWHAVILGVYYSAAGEPQVIKVQTARNVFRKLGPELIDLTLAPDSIHPATIDDLWREIEQHKKVLDKEIETLVKSPVPEVFRTAFDNKTTPPVA
jgi:hypothetical protein